jgi:two-component system, NarL family, response regulator LiaR
MNEPLQATTIILVEDHDLFRMGLRTALQIQPRIEVLGEASTATEGLALIQKHNPNVAIVDIGLPDIDGIELTRRFRDANSQSATKILILTMHDNEDAVLAAFAAGADSYCMKNVQIEQLAEAIHATHSGQAWIDPAIANTVLKHMRSSAPPVNRGTTAIKSIEPEYEQVLESYPLTERELEVLGLIVSGLSNADIAERLYITVGTVKTHVRNILNKLCADDRTQAAVRALRSGLVI